MVDVTYSFGRHVRHDPASKAHPAPTAPVAPVSWTHHGHVLNQGRVGSCTANALVQALSCGPLWVKGRRFSEKDAEALYHAETVLEGQPWPPNDPGGSGLEVCKAAQQLGLIGSYSHAFGLDHCLGALAVQPVIIGIPWRQKMFTPDLDGFLVCEGPVVGGHEVCLAGIGDGFVDVLNSWGRGWGDRGFAKLRFADLGGLLSEQGDVTVPHLP